MANNPRAAVDQALFSVLQNAYPWAYSSMHFQGWGSFSDKQPAMFLRRIRERIVSPKGPMLLKYTYEYECWIYLQTQKDDPNINPYFGIGQLASDTFQRANANPLSGSWAPVGTDGTDFVANQLISEAVYATSVTPVGVQSASYYTGIPAPADQYSQVTIGSLIDYGNVNQNPEVGVVLRYSPGNLGPSCYVMGVNQETAGFINWGLFRWNNGQETDLIPNSLFPGNLAVGDTVLGRVDGAEISLYHNGVLIGQYADANPLLSGQFGIYEVALVSTNDVSVSSWVAGGVTAAGIDPVVDAIDSALAASPVSGKNTLGGLVNECYIDGTIMLADGTDDGQAVIRIPIVTTTGI